MPVTTTVILLTPPQAGGRASVSEGSQSPSPGWHCLTSTLHTIASAGLPVVLEAGWPGGAQAVLNAAPTIKATIVPSQRSKGCAADFVASAVLLSAQSEGWLILPASMPMLRAHTLLCIALALESHPIAYPQYRTQRGHPLGVGKELFSELIRLENDRDLERLSSRYPAVGVDVDDPGVVIHDNAPFFAPMIGDPGLSEAWGPGTHRHLRR